MHHLLFQIIITIGYVIFFDQENKKLNFDFEDEIIQSSVLVYEGEIKNERFK